MNYGEIVKSYQYFYENIIPKARCFPAWNEKSIADAFLWASFCEQIYNKYCDDPEAMKNLDGEIHQLANSCTGMSSCFKNLKQSCAILCQSFLQNPNIEKNFLQEIISQIKPPKVDFEEASLEIHELDTLCLELLESLKFITFQDSDESIYIEIKAELLLDFLKDSIVYLSTEKQHENQLSFVLDTLCDNQENVALIFHILVSEADSEVVSEIQDFAMNWILLKLLDEKNGLLARFLWEQSPLKLRKAAVRFPLFSSYYIDFLTQCASSLSSEYENFTKCWKNRVSVSEVTLEYKDILEHFKVLLCVEDGLCKTIRTHLSLLLTQETKSSIWHDICFNVIS